MGFDRIDINQVYVLKAMIGYKVSIRVILNKSSQSYKENANTYVLSCWDVHNHLKYILIDCYRLGSK